MKVNGYLHTPAPLPLGKELRYPLDKRLVGPSRSGHFGEENNVLPLLGFESRPVQPS